MLKQLINFYKVSSPRPCNGETLSSSDARRLKFLEMVYLPFCDFWLRYVLCVPS